MSKTRKGRPRPYADQMPRVREMIEAGEPDEKIIAETGVPQNKVYEVRRVLEQTGVEPLPRRKPKSAPQEQSA